MAFLNDVTFMNNGVALPMASSATTVDTFRGEPGSPSGGIPMDKTQGYGIQAVWTGTSAPNGTLRLQASMDNVTFTNITGSDVAVTGAAGDALWKDFSPGYKYVRGQWVRSSGGATDSVTFKMKKLTRSGL